MAKIDDPRIGVKNEGENTEIVSEGELEEVLLEEEFVIDTLESDNGDLPIVYGHDEDREDRNNGRYFERQIPLSKYDDVKKALESGEYVAKVSLRIVKKV